MFGSVRVVVTNLLVVLLHLVMVVLVNQMEIEVEEEDLVEYLQVQSLNPMPV